MNCYSDNLLSFENVLRSSYLGPIRQQVHPRVCADVERRFNGLGEMVTGIGVTVDGRVDDEVVESISEWIHDYFHVGRESDPKPTKVVLNDPATVVFFEDDTKVVAKTHNGDEYDPLFGVMACVLRKIGKNRVRIDAWEDVIGFLAGHLADARECRLMADMLSRTADALELKGVMDAMREYDVREDDAGDKQPMQPVPDFFEKVATVVSNRVDDLDRIASVEKDVEDIKSRHERTRQTIRKLIDEGEL